MEHYPKWRAQSIDCHLQAATNLIHSLGLNHCRCYKILGKCHDCMHNAPQNIVNLGDNSMCLAACNEEDPAGSPVVDALLVVPL